MMLLYALAVGAALRMTRFFTTDELGEWLIVGHVRRWPKVAALFDCGYCIGFWVSLTVLALAAVVGPQTWLLVLYGALTTSYFVGMANSRFDAVEEPELYPDPSGATTTETVAP